MGSTHSAFQSPTSLQSEASIDQNKATNNRLDWQSINNEIFLTFGSRSFIDPSNNNGLANNKKKTAGEQGTSSQTKTIYVAANEEQKISIEFDCSEEENLTCGWLISQTIREFAKHNITEHNNKGPIVALQTVNGIVTLDYWLSELQRSVSVLRDGTTLCPFYGDPHYKITDQKVNLEYFHLIKLLGTGGTSKVYLARGKDNGKFYAMKVISKKEVVERDKEEMLFNERNIMVRVNHPFLTKLHFAFQTADQLFLVLDFFPGGELFYHLNKRGPLSESEAKIYMGEIILALNYLHKHNIIYRDLKPENILIDVDGHLHLIDFGLCKLTEDKDRLNYTFCGSPEYMAPEIVKRTGYNCAVDFYCLGMLVYEMVVGGCPFEAQTQKELFSQIVSGQIRFPKTISPQLKLFLTQLLAKNPKERLGAKFGLAEIVNHPWCSDIDFVQIASKNMKPPIIPNIYQTNFAREFVETRLSLSENSPIPRHKNIKLGEEEIKTESERNRGQTMFMKFANFSFYSNIEDPYDKFHDSIFQEDSYRNTIDINDDMKRRNSRRTSIRSPPTKKTHQPSIVPKSKFSPQKNNPQINTDEILVKDSYRASLNSSFTDYDTESHRFDNTNQLQKSRQTKSQANLGIVQPVANTPHTLQYVMLNKPTSPYSFTPARLEHRARPFRLDPKFLSAENVMTLTHFSTEIHTVNATHEDQFDKTLEASLTNKQQKTPSDIFLASLSTKNSTLYKTQPSEGIQTNPNASKYMTMNQRKSNLGQHSSIRRDSLRNATGGQFYKKEGMPSTFTGKKWRI